MSDGTTNILDRSILLAETAGGAHCDGPVTSNGGVMSDASACFTPDVSGDDTAMQMASCAIPVVAVAAPNNALEAAEPCGVTFDACGVTRDDGDESCDLGAYEAH